VVPVMNAGNVGILGSGPIMAGSIMLNPGGIMRQVLMSILPVGISGGANAATRHAEYAPTPTSGMDTPEYA
jgi:hypothetical protein